MYDWPDDRDLDIALSAIKVYPQHLKNVAYIHRIDRDFMLAAMQANGLRVTTASLKRESAGLAGLIVKLQGCELNHQIAGLAIDALGELGILYGAGDHLRADGSWQWRYMYDLGLIIGGGTAQIQKNIISERGLGMPREPKPAKV